MNATLLPEPGELPAIVDRGCEVCGTLGSRDWVVRSYCTQEQQGDYTIGCVEQHKVCPPCYLAEPEQAQAALTCSSEPAA